MSTEYKLAFIGFGTVGQGLAEILSEEKEKISAQYSADFTIVAISDMLKGAVYNSQGLDIPDVISHLNANSTLEGYKCETNGLNSIETIKQTNADIVIEVSFTDIETGEPAISHVKTALESGKHVVTTNKGPSVLAYEDLKKLADKQGVLFQTEGTVMSGTPVINLANHCLAGAEITEIRGILNGTTNYILTEMEGGMSYDEALKQAQELGYAEAQPDADVLGKDALAKIVILANSLMNAKLKPEDISCTGITGITEDNIAEARSEGFRYKLIASAKKTKDGVTANVGPEKTPLDNPLAGVSGATNAVTFVTDLLGETTVVGPGAGQKPTAFALLSDLLEIHRHKTLEQ